MSTAAPISLGQLLKQFCAADPSKVPGLAFPVYVPGTAGKTITFASDGEGVAIWTPGKLGRYRDWQATGSPDGFSPLAWRDRYRGGASTPLPLPGRSRTGQAWWLGRLAEIPARWMPVLKEFDACWIGGCAGEASTKGGPWAYASFVGTIDKRVFNGVVRTVEKS